MTKPVVVISRLIHYVDKAVPEELRRLGALLAADRERASADFAEALAVGPRVDELERENGDLRGELDIARARIEALERLDGQRRAELKEFASDLESISSQHHEELMEMEGRLLASRAEGSKREADLLSRIALLENELALAAPAASSEMSRFPVDEPETGCQSNGPESSYLYVHEAEEPPHGAGLVKAMQHLEEYCLDVRSLLHDSMASELFERCGKQNLIEAVQCTIDWVHSSHPADLLEMKEKRDELEGIVTSVYSRAKQVLENFCSGVLQVTDQAKLAGAVSVDDESMAQAAVHGTLDWMAAASSDNLHELGSKFNELARVVGPLLKKFKSPPTVETAARSDELNDDMPEAAPASGMICPAGDDIGRMKRRTKSKQRKH